MCKGYKKENRSFVECSLIFITGKNLFMATAIPLQPTSSGRKMHSLKIDMTPMVDLGFLLISFFIFTATLSQPSVTKLIMPKEGGETPTKASEAITLLLDKGKAFVYEGGWEEAQANKNIAETNYDLQSGMGKWLRAKQKSLAVKDNMVVVIKPFKTASYQNVIAALDEMQINNVKRYAIVDATPEEEKLIR
jgi:biopolymer transport protein ExbD